MRRARPLAPGATLGLARVVPGTHRIAQDDPAAVIRAVWAAGSHGPTAPYRLVTPPGAPPHDG
jgi:hypothetical protein